MKKFISILTVTALLTAPLSVLADEADITLIGDSDNSLVIESKYVDYDKQVLNGTLIEAGEEQILIDIGSEYLINIDESTVIINQDAENVKPSDLKPECAVRVVASTMETRSIPPQSYGYVIMVSDTKEPAFPIYGEIVSVHETSEGVSFATADGEYEVNVLGNTQISVLNGASVSVNDLKKGDAVLFYTPILTLSIPARCTAEKVVVIGHNEIPETDDISFETVVTDFERIIVNGSEIPAKVIAGNSSNLLPVRAVCEAMGLKVAWDENLFAVTIGTVPMGVNFKIGENAYNKARMTPFELSSAPQLINDLTYVPADFFTEVLEATVRIIDGVLNVDYQVE